MHMIALTYAIVLFPFGLKVPYLCVSLAQVFWVLYPYPFAAILQNHYTNSGATSYL